MKAVQGNNFFDFSWIISIFLPIALPLGLALFLYLRKKRNKSLKMINKLGAWIGITSLVFFAFLMFTPVDGGPGAGITFYLSLLLSYLSLLLSCF